MTQRHRLALAIAENFEQHVRATVEMAGLLIVLPKGGANRAEELSDTIAACEQTHKHLVSEEALRRLGIEVGRRGRQRIEGSP